MTEPPPVTLDIDDGLAVLTLARPRAGNALDVATCQHLERVAKLIAEDRKVRAVLMQATGKNFCVGGDISGMNDQGAARADILEAMVGPLHRAQTILAGLDAPLILAVRGAAAGAGLSLVGAADMVIASRTAKFVMAYSAIGLSPDGGATWSLPRIIGARRTLELALTNRRLDAQEALEWGLVNRVVDDAELDSAARELAETLARGPTIAFGAVRRLVTDGFSNRFEAQLDAELTSIRRTGASGDAGVGMAAFQERRPPTFKGA